MKLMEGASSDVLVDLWAARFGAGWVAVDTVDQAGEFYRSAMERLANESKVEFLYLMSEKKTVARLKPTESNDGNS